MALRINNNIAARKAVRAMSELDKKLIDSLERLSTGFRINKGADSPAGLVISEQMRGQISGVNQAIANTELANAMVQTSEGSLGEINNLLIRMRELALHANNEGANDARSVEADQIEIVNSIAAIQRIASDTQFGHRKLLDGSSGVSGAAQDGLSFVGATERTRTSPLGGYEVEVEQIPTRAFLTGDAEIEEDNVEGLSVTLIEGGKTIKVQGVKNDLPATFLGKLQEAVQEAGLQLDVTMDEDGILSVVHREYGKHPTFRAISSQGGVLSEEADVAQKPIRGQDVEGTIHGEAAKGKGQLMTGAEGNEYTQGLRVRVIGPLVESEDADGNEILMRQPEEGFAGVVHVVNSSVTFQTGPNAGQRTTFAMPATGPSSLGRNIDTQSNFQSIKDMDVTTPKGARDSIRLVDAAINEMTLVRGRLGSFQRNNLETNMATLRVTAENLVAAESSIRDASIAEELTEFTKARIQLDVATAMLAQANQLPKTVVSLIQ